MYKNGAALSGVCALLLLLSACSLQQVNPEKNVQMLIDNMHSNSYDFKGELHLQVGEEMLEETLVLDGFYVADEGYRVHADVKLPGFVTDSDVLKKNDQLYYKLSDSKQWKQTTEQDLRMLGITYKDSPSDMFQGMKEVVLSIEPTEQDSVFRITLDRHQYEEHSEETKMMRLPEVVDVQRQGVQWELLQNPVVDVEIDPDQQVIRSIKLNYVMKSPLQDDPGQPVNVTYEMYMDHFNEGQTLPDLAS